MTVLYVDTLFLLNVLVDYLLLLGAARLAGEPLRRLRFGAGALLGGLWSVGMILPGMEFLSHPLCRGAACLIMLVTAYGGSLGLLRQMVIFLAVTCTFCGGVMAVELLGGRGNAPGGAYCPVPDLKTLVLSAAVCYVVLSAFFQRLGRRTAIGGELLPVRLSLEGRSTELIALVDTGNTLTDPLTGRGAMVAEGDALQALFPDGRCPGKRDLLDPVGGLDRLGKGFSLLPFRAVGVERGLLLAVRVDDCLIAGRGCGPLLVALSPTPLSDSGRYRALVGPPEGEDGRW